MIDYPYFAIFLGIGLMLLLSTLIGGLIARNGKFPLPPAKRRIGCIDGLRGYLALSVLVNHFVERLQESRLGWREITTPTFHFFNQTGAGGVALFFMITGLVFYPRVLTGWRACSWISVYINRVFRLIPLIVVSVILVTLVIIFRTGNGFDAKYPWAFLQWITAYAQPPLLGYSNARMVNAGVLWTLKIEWVFYLAILPFCALVMDITRKWNLPSWIVPVGMLCVDGLIWIAKSHGLLGHHWPRVIDNLPPVIPCFAVGMIAFECQRRPGLVKWFSSRMAAAIATAGMLFAVFTFHVPYDRGLPFFGFFFICIACGNDFFGIFRLRGALVLGECSYGIYLMHGIVLDLLYVELHDFVASLPLDVVPSLLIPVTAAIVVPFTALTYLCIERPAISLGRTVQAMYKGNPPLRGKA